MEWIEGKDCNWGQMIREDKSIVVVLNRNEIKDVICGYISRYVHSEIEITSNHQGIVSCHTYEIEKVMILQDLGFSW